MNISKKALMSVLMALTPLVAMAQPYYHIMKQDDGKLTEEAMYDGQTYKVKIDMEKPVEKPEEVKPEEVKPECAIGNKITIPSCGLPYKSFYFTNKGNIYYDASKRKLFFEETQLDYPKKYSENHRGHFRWGKSLSECLGNGSSYYSEYNPPRNSDFYFANPANLPKLQEDLGNEKWTVLNSCEWGYVLRNLGERWEVDGKTCFLIDTTPDKSLLKAIETKNGGKTMSKEDFFEYEAQGLVCLPPTGHAPYFYRDDFWNQGTEGDYWTCTPWGDDYDSDRDFKKYATAAEFSTNSSGLIGMYYGTYNAVRLVILAD